MRIVMNRYPVIFAVALLLSGVAPSTAATLYAHGMRGQLGQQSRSAIRISVTVAPRFAIDQGPQSRTVMQTDELGAIEPIAVSTNAHSLRYHLVADDFSDYRSLFERGALHGGAINSEVPLARARSRPSGDRLILIVPD